LTVGPRAMEPHSNRSLVSIIIPCYNCERWVQQAVESCLNQTYPNIEIIVVDDGSTDGSREVLRHFVPRIRLETGPNRGGNSARNRGFAHSTGEYIQYLDADDYLEPEKIARQVRFLERTKADVVYGDWRHRRHHPNGSFSYLDGIEVAGAQQDILAALLSFRLVNGGAVLYRRQTVKQVGGWDETLHAFQDMDFFTSVALSGAKIRYQPGCHFIYRKYGAVTVSTSSFSRWSENTCISLKKSEVALARSGRLTEEYRAALAVGYFKIAQACFWFEGAASLATYEKTINNTVNEILDLCPHYHATDETHIFRLVQWLFGFKSAIHLLFRARSAIRLIKFKLKSTFFVGYILGIRREMIFRREAKRHSLSASAEVGSKRMN